MNISKNHIIQGKYNKPILLDYGYKTTQQQKKRKKKMKQNLLTLNVSIFNYYQKYLKLILKKIKLKFKEFFCEKQLFGQKNKVFKTKRIS